MFYDKSDMQTIIDKSLVTIYIGLSTYGAKMNNPQWLIKRIHKVGNITTISFANNEKEFNKKWTLRASYNYEIG